MEPTYDRSNSEITWANEIPFDGSPLPADEAAYQWLLNSGVPEAEARFRVWSRLPAASAARVRPLVAANRWRQEFAAMYDDDSYNPATVAPEWQPSRAAIDLVMSLQ